MDDWIRMKLRLVVGHFAGIVVKFTPFISDFFSHYDHL